jgi:hypothetical protein
MDLFTIIVENGGFKKLANIQLRDCVNFKIRNVHNVHNVCNAQNICNIRQICNIRNVRNI